MDIDFDCDVDLLVGNSVQDSSYLAVNNGTGIFTRDNDRMPFIFGTLQGADYGDVDNDGDLDIYAGINYHPDVLLINDGLGYFDISPERIPQIDSGAIRVKIADFDNDLDLDILLVVYGQSPRILINDGYGYFIDDTQDRIDTEYGLFGGINDVDNDNDVDILIVPRRNCLIFLNDGSGHFIDESAIRFPDLHGGSAGDVLTFADADNDGDDDICFGYAGWAPDYLLVNDGHGYFENQTEQRMPPNRFSTRDAVLADYDGDGDVDYFRVGDANARNSIYINTLNNPDSIPPVFMNVEIADEIVIEPGPYPFRCFVNDGVSLASRQVKAELYYSLDSISFIPVEMFYSGGFMFRAEIPEVDSGSTVYYYYYSEDHQGNHSTLPILAPDEVFSFTYLPEYTGISENLSRRQLRFSCYPNPLNSTTTLTFDGFEGGDLSIRIYDVTGTLVRTLDTKEGKATWDATDNSGRKVSSGIYFAQVRTPQNSNTIKLIYLK